MRYRCKLLGRVLGESLLKAWAGRDGSIDLLIFPFFLPGTQKLMLVMEQPSWDHEGTVRERPSESQRARTDILEQPSWCLPQDCSWNEKKRFLNFKLAFKDFDSNKQMCFLVIHLSWESDQMHITTLKLEDCIFFQDTESRCSLTIFWFPAPLNFPQFHRQHASDPIGNLSSCPGR